MSRLFNFVLLTAMIIGAVVTYEMKHRAEVAAERVVRLDAQIAREKEDIQLLRAELSMLLQPGRLQALVERYPDYFKLEAFSPDQYATLGEIPLKPVGPPDEKAIADIIGQDKSTIR